MLRMMSSLCMPNFDSVPSRMPKLQLIIHFPQVNPLVPGLKGAVSRSSAKLGNYKMPVKLRET